MKFTLVSGTEFVKTLEIEDVQMGQVQNAIAEFKGQVDPWIEVDGGAWIRLEAVVAIEPVERSDERGIARRAGIT